MENKKQLILIPPLSESLQKLHEIIKGIADEENIDISTIENFKELAQFLGSTGQSLLAFSNAKTCASFLQENRLILNQTHSKVILLTPKEIPTKTLVKFVKMGLTESILETAPPKTLLHKVKLLLRSIKSTNAKAESKDQVVKSMMDLSQPSNLKSDVVLEKNANTGDALDPLLPEKEKKKKEIEENVFGYGARLKGKSNFQEESIETSWKSKRKTDESLSEGDDFTKSHLQNKNDSSEIDLYLRSKQKNKGSTDQLEAATPLLKNRELDPEEDEKLDSRKKSLEVNLDLTPGPKRNASAAEENDDDDYLRVKTKEETSLFDQEDSDQEEENQLSPAEEEEIKKKELEELDALIEDAQKKKKENTEPQNDPFYRGKIATDGLTLDQDENEGHRQRPIDSDSSDEEEKQTRNKPTAELDFSDDEESSTKNPEDQDSEDEENSKRKKVDSLTSHMKSGIRTKEKDDSDIDEEDDDQKIKKRANQNNLELDEADLKSKDDIENEEADADEKNPSQQKNLFDDADDQLANHKKDEDEDEDQGHLKSRKKQTELEMGEGEDDLNQKDGEVEDEDQDYQNEKLNQTEIHLHNGDGDSDKSKKEENNDDDNIQLKKLNQTNLDLDTDKGSGKAHGKVDMIDTYYRHKDGKAVEQNWDNLTDKAESLDLNKVANKAKNQEAFSINLPQYKGGEITIDYRMLKEEFEDMSRSRSFLDQDKNFNKKNASLIENEDQGSFQVIEIDARGLAFAIDIINLINQKDSKAQDFYKKTAEELINNYKGYPVFYTYKLSENMHHEVFDSFLNLSDSMVSTELKEWWVEAKKSADTFAHYYQKSMATWLCRDIPSKSTEGVFWEDIELPSWAENELKDKKVELIFPYYDGLDKMGMAIVFFPEGIKAKDEPSINISLEILRTVFLETIQRKVESLDDKLRQDENKPTENKNVMSIFSGLFNRKKAG